MKSPDAPSAGDVVHPQRRTKCAGDFFRDEAVLREDGNHEGEDAHEMRCVATQSFAFVQRFVHESDIALLQIPQSAVHQLR